MEAYIALRTPSTTREEFEQIKTLVLQVRQQYRRDIVSIGLSYQTRIEDVDLRFARNPETNPAVKNIKKLLDLYHRLPEALACIFSWEFISGDMTYPEQYQVFRLSNRDMYRIRLAVLEELRKL